MVWNTFIHERKGLKVKTRTKIFINIESPKNSKSEVQEINQWLHVQSKKTNIVSLIHYCIARFGQVDLISDDGLKNSYEPSISDKLFQSAIAIPENKDFGDMTLRENLYVRYDTRSAKEIEEINKWIDVQSYIGISIKLAIRFFINRFGYRDIEDLQVSKWLYIGLHFDKLVEKGILNEEQASFLYLANSSTGALKTSPSMDFNIQSNKEIKDNDISTSSPVETSTERSDASSETKQSNSSPSIKEEKEETSSSISKKKVDLSTF